MESSRSVFVGNIPYDATEEALIELMRTVGPVVSLRLVFYKDTGKPKGYGFCEFADTATANMACRQLSGYIFKGLMLRVQHFDERKEEDVAIRKALKTPREVQQRDADAAPDQPTKKRRIGPILDDFQHAELTFEDLGALSPAVRSVLFALAEVLKAEKKA